MELKRHNAESEKNPAFLDWLAFTLPLSGESFDYIRERFGEPIPRERGVNGYSESALLPGGGIVGWSPHRPDDRLFVNLSAKALAFCSAIRDGHELLADVFNHGARLNRVDLAIDDRDGLLTVDTIDRAIDERNFTSRFRSAVRLNKRKFRRHSVDPAGDTLYIGTRGSESFLRIYDKRQQVMILDPDGGDPGHWVRVEFECRGDRAEALGRELLRGLNPGRFVLGFFAPREPGTDRQERRPVAEYWRRFLDAVDPERVTITKPERCLEDVCEWLENTAGGSLAAINRAMGREEIDRLIAAGQKKLSRNKNLSRMVLDYEHTKANGTDAESLPGDGGGDYQAVSVL